MKPLLLHPPSPTTHLPNLLPPSGAGRWGWESHSTVYSIKSSVRCEPLLPPPPQRADAGQRTPPLCKQQINSRRRVGTEVSHLVLRRFSLENGRQQGGRSERRKHIQTPATLSGLRASLCPSGLLLRQRGKRCFFSCFFFLICRAAFKLKGDSLSFEFKTSSKLS